MGLPDQPTEFARSFPGWELFENGVYVPTGEDAADYEQVSAGPEFFAGREPEPIDHLTRCIIWLNYSIRAWYDKKRHVVRDDLKSINSESNKRIMHLVAAIYMSIFLSGTLGTLSVLSSEKRRIVVLGILGLVLQVSLVLLIPGLKRNDMVAILAAYFAVGGIYIGTKSNITS